MKFNDWKEFVIYGVGGLILFLISGIASVTDIMSYTKEEGGLFFYCSKNSGYNNLSIVFTLTLILFSIIGLAAFVFYTRKKFRKPSKITNSNGIQE